jgi:hypothetical protein
VNHNRDRYASIKCDNSKFVTKQCNLIPITEILYHMKALCRRSTHPFRNSGLLINLKQFLNIQNLRYYHSTTFHNNIVYDNLHLSYIMEHISCHKCCDIDQQNERFQRHNILHNALQPLPGFSSARGQHKENPGYEVGRGRGGYKDCLVSINLLCNSSINGLKGYVQGCRL